MDSGGALGSISMLPNPSQSKTNPLMSSANSNTLTGTGNAATLSFNLNSNGAAHQIGPTLGKETGGGMPTSGMGTSSASNMVVRS